MDETDNVRYAALNYAIKSACGTEVNDFGSVCTNPDKLIAAAKIIETYLKGEINAQN